MTEDNLENCMIFRVKETELMLKWGDYTNSEIVVYSRKEMDRQFVFSRKRKIG